MNYIHYINNIFLQTISEFLYIIHDNFKKFKGEIIQMKNCPACPVCKSENIIKNGSVHNGKPKFMCRDCRRQFVENPANKIIPGDTWETVEKLLLEKIPIAGISRVTGISEPWLQKYINEKYENIPKKISIVKEKGRLTIQCDEMWSFVGSKNNKKWIWLAIDQDSREIVGVFVGSRDRKGATGSLGFAAGGLSSVCRVLYRFLVGIRSSFSVKKA